MQCIAVTFCKRHGNEGLLGENGSLIFQDYIGKSYVTVKAIELTKIFHKYREHYVQLNPRVAFGMHRKLLNYHN